MAATVKSTARVFGGILQRMTHQSAVCKCEMTFAVYLPAQSEAAAVHSLYWLSGLTCTDENFAQKAGGFRAAAARGLALVMPDTSPRGVTIEGADDAYDFGSGAGFYVDATEAKWKDHYQMYSYVTKELPAVLAATFPAQLSGKASISGHSMGGHGALTLFLKNPGMYASASAFAPICSPTRCPWGTKAFEGYLGSVEAGKAHDAVELINGLSSGDGLELQRGQSARLAGPQLGSCASSGRSWRLWAARHSQEEAGSLSAQRAASEAADVTALDHAGAARRPGVHGQLPHRRCRPAAAHQARRGVRRQGHLAQPPHARRCVSESREYK